MLKDCVDDRVPVIAVKFVAGAFEREERCSVDFF
jgi:hypothetical protein